jgi:hypothetical protein
VKCKVKNEQQAENEENIRIDAIFMNLSEYYIKITSRRSSRISFSLQKYTKLRKKKLIPV